MDSVSSKPRVALLVIGGVAFSSAILGTPAQAADPCNDALISVVAVSGYTCTLGTVTYSFATDLTELNTPTTPAPMITFENLGDMQRINFINLQRAGKVNFSYTVQSSVLDILPYSNDVASALQLYTQTSSNGNPPMPALINRVKLPDAPLPQLAPTNFRFEPDFTPYGANTPGYPVATLTSLSNTIRMTPGPLPIVGAGCAFAMSRKLRRRIKQSS